MIRGRIKSLLLMAGAVMLLGITACAPGKEGESGQADTTTKEATTEYSFEASIAVDEVETIDFTPDEQKTYGKYKVVHEWDSLEDYNEITKIVLELEGLDPSQGTYEAVQKEGIGVDDKPMEYLEETATIQRDGVTYWWRTASSTDSYQYFCDRGRAEISTEDARKLADSLAVRLGLDLDMEAEVNEGHPEIKDIMYYQRKDGIRIMAKSGASGNGSGDSHASYVSFAICGNDVCSFSMTPPLKVTETVETYTQEDFLSEQEMVDMTTAYLQAYYDKFSRVAEDLTLEEWRLVYMVYTDGGETYLMPVYRVVTHAIEKGEGRSRFLVMDACTGYVYHMSYELDRWKE